MDKLTLRKNNPAFENCISRECVLRIKNDDDGGNTFRGVLATEQPAIVADWYNWRMIREVVLIDGMEVPEKMPLLDAHSRFEISNIKGSTTNPEKVEDPQYGKIYEADNVFSSTAEKELTLAREGHLDSTSIGYQVFPEHTVELRPGEEREINGKMFKNDYADKLPFVIRLKSRVFENSLVPIGADSFAKFRSMFESNELIEQSNKEMLKLIQDEVKNLDNKINVIKLNKGSKEMEPEVLEQQRKDSINKMAEDFQSELTGIDLKQRAKLFVESGRSVADFSETILKNIEQKAAVAKPTVDLTKKQIEKYSISRGVAHLLNPKLGDCLEMEVSREFQEKSGITSGGFTIPHSLMNEKAQYLKRDVNSTATTGGDFIATDHLSGEWIDTLKNDTIAAQLGVRFLPGRKGNIKIPKLTTGNTFGWASSENAQVSESSPVTTYVSMSPKRGGFFVDISKQAALQSDPALDSVLTEDGRMVMAIGLDQGLFHGDGTGDSFTGIANISNVQTLSAASLTWAKALEFAKKVKLQNAVLGELKFAFDPTIEATLMGRAKEAGYPVYIIGEDGKLAGRPYVVSNQITSKYMFFGSFSQAYMALWDGIDVTVDPYSLATYNLVRITFNQLADCAVRYPQAFVFANDAD